MYDLFISLVKENKDLTKEQKREKIKQLKKERKARLKDPVRKEWKKYMKKSKKELIKLAKEFTPWDYCFILDPLKKMIDMFYNTYKHKELLVQDTNHSNYKETIESLERCHYLIEKLDSDDNDIMDEYDIIEELLETMKKHILMWWD